MKRESLLTIAVVALLLLNLGTLGFLFLGKGPGHGPLGHRPGMGQGPDRLIIEGLKLNKEQIEKFEILKREHHEAMMKSDPTDRNLHKAYFALLKNDKPDMAKADSLKLKMQKVMDERNTITFEHFRKLRALLADNQKKLFDDLIDEISRALKGPQGHGRMGPGGPPDDRDGRPEPR